MTPKFSISTTADAGTINEVAEMFFGFGFDIKIICVYKKNNRLISSVMFNQVSDSGLDLTLKQFASDVIGRFADLGEKAVISAITE